MSISTCSSIATNGSLSFLRLVPTKKQRALMNNEELAMAYVNGDEKSFDMLVERNRRKLFSYILFVVRNKDIAEDVFQDTFMKVLVKLQSGEYQPTGKFSAWLTRIAHNIIIDRFREEQNDNVVDVNDENDMSRIEDEFLTYTPAESSYMNEQTLTQVKRLMEALPSVQREVVFMRFFQDMPFKEIAEATGVSINTSLGRMRYAVMNMRRLVKENNLELQLL